MPAKKVTEEKQAGDAPVVHLISLRAQENYHNGAISGGVGANWRAGEVRQVTFTQFEQLMSDRARVFERVK